MTAPRATGGEPCRNVPDLMFGEDYYTARQVCLQGCPIFDACREYAIASEPWGVWGGLTGEERRAIRRRRGIVLDEPQTLAVGRHPKRRGAAA